MTIQPGEPKSPWTYHLAPSGGNRFQYWVMTPENSQISYTEDASLLDLSNNQRQDQGMFHHPVMPADPKIPQLPRLVVDSLDDVLVEGLEAKKLQGIQRVPDPALQSAYPDNPPVRLRDLLFHGVYRGTSEFQSPPKLDDTTFRLKTSVDTNHDNTPDFEILQPKYIAQDDPLAALRPQGKRFDVDLEGRQGKMDVSISDAETQRPVAALKGVNRLDLFSDHQKNEVVIRKPKSVAKETPLEEVPRITAYPNDRVLFEQMIPVPGSPGSFQSGVPMPLDAHASQEGYTVKRGFYEEPNPENCHFPQARFVDFNNDGTVDLVIEEPKEIMDDKPVSVRLEPKQPEEHLLPRAFTALNNQRTMRGNSL